MLTRVCRLLLFLAPLAVAACSPDPGNREAAGLPPIPAPPDVAGPPAGAQRSPSGVAWTVLTPGTGTRHPRPNSEVTVHYTGWTTDGRMFDSSVQRGEPTSFPLDQVIPGWTEAVQMMVEGEKRRFWIPGNLAYDNSPRPDAPKGMLVFEIELIRIDS